MRIATPHSELPLHCHNCGAVWPKPGQRGRNGICVKCKAGLPCRADTTDTVAPDPPCMGSWAVLGWRSTACPSCSGHGIRSGALGDGVPECSDCGGSGQLWLVPSGQVFMYPGGPARGSWAGAYEKAGKASLTAVQAAAMAGPITRVDFGEIDLGIRPT